MKYSLSKASQNRLDTCHEDWHVICDELCNHVNFSVFCGHRGKFEQNQAFARGYSDLEWPDSKHNKLPSMAIDMGPYFAEIRNTDWEDFGAFAVFAGMVKIVSMLLLAQGKISHRVRWGGDWDGDGRTIDHKFRDAPHFELVVI